MKSTFRKIAVGVSVVSILALVAGTGGDFSNYLGNGFVGPAAAAGNGNGGGGNGGGGNGGGDGKGGSAGAPGMSGQQGQGQGGPGEDSEGQGPRAGQAGSGQRGKPIWAQEGIPEVELGRLNVARAPAHVLDRAYAEALKSLTPEMAAFYSQSLDAIIAALRTDFDNATYIDSPLQNLALLRDALDGSISLPGVTNTNETLMAVFIGVASDKTVPITKDTVVALTSVLGTPVTGQAAQELADDAEAVREAVAEGHG